MFDQQPFVALFAALDLDQNEAPAQLLAVQAEFDLAVLQLLQCIEAGLLWLASIVFHNKRSAVPNHDATRAIIALGNFPFEAAILQRMILSLHGESFVCMTPRRPLRYGPGFQCAVNRQPEVVVQPRRGMFLHHEGVSILRSRTNFQSQLWHGLRQAGTRARGYRLALPRFARFR